MDIFNFGANLSSRSIHYGTGAGSRSFYISPGRGVECLKILNKLSVCLEIFHPDQLLIFVAYSS